MPGDKLGRILFAIIIIQEEKVMIRKKTEVILTMVVLGLCDWSMAAPLISNVRMQQRQNSRIVDVWYDLADEDAIVTLGVETNGVAIPASAVTHVSGDVGVVVSVGSNKRIVWLAGADWPDNQTASAKARITAWSTNSPPMYLVVDLEGGVASGSFPFKYYEEEGALPDGGLTNAVYRCSRIVLRRIRTGAPWPEDGLFLSGSNHRETGRYATREDQHFVRLTKDYYMAVFETTQGQWLRVMGSNPSFYQNHPDCWETRPVERVSWRHIRMSADNSWNGVAKWPENAPSVGPGSFMAVLRDKTGLNSFDLPTEMQWEYACRAGTTRALYFGGGVGYNLTNATADAELTDKLRYQYNGGQDNPSGTPTYWPDDVDGSLATAVVGSYTPNPWGLYDMLGNVFELCLDNYIGSLGYECVVDPVGIPTPPDSDRQHTRKGGSIAISAAGCRSAYRGGITDTGAIIDTGFRIVLNLN